MVEEQQNEQQGYQKNAKESGGIERKEETQGFQRQGSNLQGSSERREGATETTEEE